jgi:hypothetical protein
MWLLPRSSIFELGHDRRKSYRAANGSFGSNSPVAACFGERRGRGAKASSDKQQLRVDSPHPLLPFVGRRPTQAPSAHSRFLGGEAI